MLRFKQITHVTWICLKITLQTVVLGTLTLGESPSCLVDRQMHKQRGSQRLHQMTCHLLLLDRMTNHLEVLIQVMIFLLHRDSDMIPIRHPCRIMLSTPASIPEGIPMMAVRSAKEQNEIKVIACHQLSLYSNVTTGAGSSCSLIGRYSSNDGGATSNVIVVLLPFMHIRQLNKRKHTTISLCIADLLSISFSRLLFRNIRKNDLKCT